MEERHTISEPRILSSTHLSWLVDITREGVHEPVDTIEINENTLPPRKKKGKIVWRLPSDAEKLPSFPADERRRIMELFKERKKQRKKKAMKVSSSSNQSMDISQSSSSNNRNNAQIDKNELNGDSTHNNPLNVQNEQEGTTKEQSEENESSEQVAPSISIPKSETASGRFQRKRKERKARAQSLESESQPSPKLEHYEEPRETAHKKIENVLEETISKLTKLEMTENASDASRISTQIQDILAKLNSDCDDPSVNVQSQSSEQQMKLPPSHTVLPDAKFLVIPDHDRPVTTDSSLAIVAAKYFVDLYYPHISHGLANELAFYYTSNAQKSVSVGGAHSVVGTREDIKLQLSSLAGSHFLVRGVVSQDTFEKAGAHILVTGNMQTTAGIMTPFAHSVDLVLMNGEFDFQIHNDALSLLTPSEELNQGPNQSLPGLSRPPGLNF